MSAATEDRVKAARYPEGDVLQILYSHHATVHELVDMVESSKGADRTEAFERLTALLSAHEAAEEAVVRPVTVETAGDDVAEARNAEESEADKLIARLSGLDVDSSEFETQFAKFKTAVTAHAEAEENMEFPTLDTTSETERRDMGERFLQEFRANGGEV